MKKNYLFVGYDTWEAEEISEFIKKNSSSAVFAASNEHAIRILDDIPIDIVVVYMRSMNDAVILRYVNRYFPEVRVVVSANKEFDELISIFHKGIFSRLPRPFKLDELNTVQ